MKKLVLTLFIALVAMAAGARTVRALPVTLDVNNLVDGEYSVSFDVDKVVSSSKGVYIDFTVYTDEEFDSVQVMNLKPGDKVEANFAEIEVATFGRNADGMLVVNEDDLPYFFFESERGFNISNVLEVNSAVECGVVRLLVPNSVTFVDQGINGSPYAVKRVHGKRLAKYLPSCWNTNFDQGNVSITLKNGKIVRFQRDYMP